MKRPHEDNDLHAAMVEALYGTPITIVYGMAMICGLVLCAYVLKPDLVILGLLVALVGLTAFRTYSNSLYIHHGRGVIDRSVQTKYEIMACAGAWGTALSVGCFGWYTVVTYPFESASILGVAQTMGYLAGISTRNSSRPYITQVQVVLASLPFMGGLIWTGDWAYICISIAVGTTLLSTISSVKSICEVFTSRFKTMRQLEKLASTDVLTGLSNRYFLTTEIEKRRHAGANFALISVDLDNFKHVNDMFGHEIGDLLLADAAARIASHFGGEDIVARIGGDEFLILMSKTDLAEVQNIATRVINDLSVPFVIRSIRLSTGASAGIAVQVNGTNESIFKNVDLALYSAKDSGKNQIVIYSPEIGRKYDERIKLERDLRRAIECGDISLAYQPVVDPKTRRTILVEALMRWNHPERGAIPPSVFIPLAESAGLITLLGSWAIQTACQLATIWPNDIGVSVNLSSKQFRRDHDLVAVVAACLKSTGLSAERLTLEITESVLIDDQDFVVETLTRLRALGVKTALDDFGTGFSSLSYLAELPIDKIKIDRTFVSSIVNSPKCVSLMRGITSIARDLELQVIVEGIETIDQLDALSEFSIDGIQGYIFARPVDAVTLLPYVAYKINPGEQFTQVNQIAENRKAGGGKAAKI